MPVERFLSRASIEGNKDRFYNTQAGKKERKKWLRAGCQMRCLLQRSADPDPSLCRYTPGVDRAARDTGYLFTDAPLLSFVLGGQGQRWKLGN
ncbi:hypothetical protein BaRGS_00017507 [Batillaria attramentaria]|uniref:Uncharacterized protein n=1 Tax=Batillaria attramentaria TaxID=370345 RepID=A0ABD0KVZ4_9CAEN